jgi:DNA repair protein RecN (Recombination protein N)
MIDSPYYVVFLVGTNRSDTLLKQLTVRQFAIISDITIDFKEGMTVLTGETGAGKSLLIDAISFIIGDRASSDMIRSGAEKAEVIALFEVYNEHVLNGLQRLRADDGNKLVIYRDITLQNKNTIKINKVSVSLQQLRDITKHLADVHSQFDTQRLINPDNYLGLIDHYKPELLRPYLEKYRQDLHLYQQSLQSMHQLEKSKKDLLEKQEIYRYQLSELLKLSLSVDEETTLIQETKWMQNFDKVFRDLNEIKQLFEEHHLLDGLYEIKVKLEHLSQSMSEYETYLAKCSDFYYEFDDLSMTVSNSIEKLSFDPLELDRMIERLHTIQQAKKKYQMTIPELLEHQAYVQSVLDRTDHFDELLQKAQEEVKKFYQIVVKSAKEVSIIRQEIAHKITHQLGTVFQDLVLPHTIFEITFQPMEFTTPYVSSVFTENGVDVIEFMITTNPGEPLKPLNKTVSGGEMSRIMLAFKTIFIQSQQLETIVFDEIDTGISGHIAKQIAKKIRSIASSTQVISISHLPQVVAIAKTHLYVQKVEIDKRTTASLRELQFEERVQAIAEMISGSTPSRAAIESAKELLLN